MKPRHEKAKEQQPPPNEPAKDQGTREEKVKTYGHPEQAEGIGRRKIGGGPLDSSYTERQTR